MAGERQPLCLLEGVLNERALCHATGTAGFAGLLGCARFSHGRSFGRILPSRSQAEKLFASRNRVPHIASVRRASCRMDLVELAVRL